MSVNSSNKKKRRELIWVKHGRTEYQAFLLDSIPDKNDGKVRIQWESDRKIARIHPTYIISSSEEDTEPRRKRKRRKCDHHYDSINNIYTIIDDDDDLEEGNTVVVIGDDESKDDTTSSTTTSDHDSDNSLFQYNDDDNDSLFEYDDDDDSLFGYSNDDDTPQDDDNYDHDDNYCNNRKNAIHAKKSCSIFKRKKVSSKKQNKKGRKQRHSLSKNDKLLSAFKDNTVVKPIDINNMTLNYIALNNNIKPKNSFVYLWANGRILVNEVKVTGDMSKNNPGGKFTFGERNFSLLARKFHRNAKKGQRCGFTSSNDRIELLYVATNGSGIQVEWDIQEELEKIADFASLRPIKVIARLQLLLTPAVKPSNVIWSTINSFSFIEKECGHEGCGYIPEDMLEEWLGRKMAKRIDSLQVRIVGPYIGISKGMLLKKRGIQRIQIPPSMRKVNPSRSNKENWVVIVIKGTFPNSNNHNLGRYLDPEAKKPCESFMKNSHKPLSQMYIRLMCGLGIPKGVMNNYTQNCRDIEGRKHAHLKGVIDPTEFLPEGHVFIPGFIAQEDGEKQKIRRLFSECFATMLVSRSPAVEPTDIKMLPVVNRKPEKMPEETWDWLCSLDFGHIIFAMPSKSNPVPLSKLVADGDLDGDDYFICWDKNILERMNNPPDSIRRKLKVLEEKQLEIETRKIISEKKREKDKSISTNNLSGEDQHHNNVSTWFHDAQKSMCDLTMVKDQSAITGKLYTLCFRVSDDPKSGGIFDKDAITFGRAYKESLDVVKHGGKVQLPLRLKNDLDKKFHNCIESI